MCPEKRKKKKKRRRKSEDSIWTLRNLVVIIFYVLQEIESGQVRANKIGRFLFFFFLLLGAVSSSNAGREELPLLFFIKCDWALPLSVSLHYLGGNTLSCKLQSPPERLG